MFKYVEDILANGALRTYTKSTAHALLKQAFRVHRHPLVVENGSLLYSLGFNLLQVLTGLLNTRNDAFGEDRQL